MNDIQKLIEKSQRAANRTYTIEHARPKAFWLFALIVFCMGALTLRLLWLEILQSKYYRAWSLENSSRVTFLRAPRGLIYDRHGNLLATNKESLSMIAIPLQLGDPQEIAPKLASILNLPEQDVLDELYHAKESSSVTPIVIEHDLSLETVGRFFEQRLWLPGIDILPDISRNYPQGELFAHVIGYTGEITENQLKRRPERKMGDVIGQEGIERLYDDQLRGIDGQQRVRVNAAGGTFSAATAKPKVTKEPVAGMPIVLSLDSDLQKVASDALGERHGAVVAVDPQTGEVLAMVSHPTFDPNVFTHRITPDEWKQINAPDHPLFNRAVSAYPPGSTWKPVTLLAALANKVVKPDTKLQVSGGIALGNFFFHDWTSTPGLFDLVKCLAWSRDSAFYQMGLHLTPEQIKEWGVKLGANRPTGIELSHEGVGIVPDSDWKWRVYHEKWYPGNTLHMSIGQSFVDVTPMQEARMYSGIGMKGQLPNLHFVIKLGDRQIPPPTPEKVKFNPEYLDVVLKGLKAVVASGTAGATKLGSVEVAGKTGTAEATPVTSKPHAWFSCYAPADKPRIALCVFVEHGGHGGSTCAPIAKIILEKFFGIASDAPQGKAPSAAVAKKKTH